MDILVASCFNSLSISHTDMAMFVLGLLHCQGEVKQENLPKCNVSYLLVQYIIAFI